MLKLFIGNKAYSSWSLRPWLAMKQAGLTFEEEVIPLGTDATHGQIRAAGGGTKVPVLHDGRIIVWESLAIIDYVDRVHAAGRLWPGDPAAFGLAKAISAEMHAGFIDLRSHCPMNVRRRREPYPLTPGAAADVERIGHLWTQARITFGAGGDFLFGAFSAADAMFAPVVMRLHFYAVPLSPTVARYAEAVLALPAIQEWLAAAANEPWIMADSERY